MKSNITIPVWAAEGQKLWFHGIYGKEPCVSAGEANKYNYGEHCVHIEMIDRNDTKVVHVSNLSPRNDD